MVMIFYGRFFRYFMVETIGETMDTEFHVIKKEATHATDDIGRYNGAPFRKTRL